MPRPVLPLDVADLTGSRLADVLGHLTAALDGSGPVVQPVHGAGPRPASVNTGDLSPDEDDPADPTAVVVTTSGSTGDPKQVLLPGSALRASATATHERFGGPGRWLLALPAQHVAGVQVLVRSLLAGGTPTVLDLRDGFSAAGFTAATRLVGEGRRYTALVPTQLVRLLDGGAEAREALASFDAVLVGGAPCPDPLRWHAQEAGVRVVTSYGMSETSGGCVYDGVPLDGTSVRLDDGGRILLGGPAVARGYRAITDNAGAPGPFRVEDGVRWFRTDDVGTWADDPTAGAVVQRRLIVLGRVDDLLISGGVNVSPQAVEAVLVGLPGVLEALVVGVPDPQWGQRVVALVRTDGARLVPDRLDQVRAAVAASLGVAAAPRQLVEVDALPVTVLGKPDRVAAAELARRSTGG